MPLDPSISLQAGQGVRPIDPMAAFQQALTLRALSDQSQAQQMAMQQQQRAMQRQQGIDKAYVVGPDGQLDQTATMRNLASGGYSPEAAQFSQQALKQRLENEKAQREAQKAQYESVGKQVELRGRVMGALRDDASYLDAIRAAQFLNENGDKIDITQISQDPTQRARQIQQFRMHASTEFENYRKQFGPQTDTAKAFIDMQGATPEQMPAYRNMIAMTGGKPDDLVRFENGQTVLNPAALAARTKIAEAGKPTTKIDVNLPINAYEKKLNQNDADAVSKARANSEGLGAAAGEVRAIADALKGYSGGRWDEAKAKLGEYLPGTPWADMASVNQIAESIRQKAGPAQRVEGSGSTSDVEFKGMMASLPSLLMYEKGRELVARTFERRAQQAQISADIKDQLVRGGAYSAARHAEEMKKQFGDRLFTREDMDLMRQIKSGKGAESAAPKKSYKGLWRSQ